MNFYKNNIPNKYDLPAPTNLPTTASPLVEMPAPFPRVKDDNHLYNKQATHKALSIIQHKNPHNNSPSTPYTSKLTHKKQSKPSTHQEIIIVKNTQSNAVISNSQNKLSPREMACGRHILKQLMDRKQETVNKANVEENSKRKVFDYKENDQILLLNKQVNEGKLVPTTSP